MNRPSIALCLAASLAVNMALSTSSALADMTKAQCIDANGKGQELRRVRKLSSAREQFRQCADAPCPSILRDDCTKRLDELESSQPSIVFEATDGSGADLFVVRVSVDSRVVTEKLDGAPVEIDPGEHTLTFEVAGHPSVTDHILVVEGAKARRERVVIGAPQPQVATAGTGPPAAPAPTPGMGTQKMIGLVAGGVGVAGVVVGSIFGLLTASAISQQKSDCASSATCPHPQQAASDHSTWTTDGTVSTVAFIAGGVLLAGGAALFFTAHPASEQPAAARLVVTPGLEPGGGGLLVRGEF